MARQRRTESSSDSRRAPRFPIRVPLLYRVDGEATWRPGKTENISYTGIFFRTEFIADRETRIEMNFVLPVKNARERGAEVVCRGDIVRLEASAGSDKPSALAARIWDYRLKRGDEITKPKKSRNKRSAGQKTKAAFPGSLEYELGKAGNPKAPPSRE
jgi:hypothetical protein